MTDHQPCVLIYNPLASHGHLNSWFVMFVQKFMVQGYRVLAMAPNAEQLIAEMLEKHAPHAGAAEVEVLPWKLPRQSISSRALRRIKSLLRRSNQDSGQTSQVDQLDPELNYLEPEEFAKRLQFGLTQTGWKPSFALNMYMDLYRTDSTRWLSADSFMPLPWAGIRFIPTLDMREAYYRIPSLKGMLLLDQQLVTEYRDQHSDKVFAYLPDITDASLPEQTSEIVKEILLAAKGRKIVFMGGTIGRTKNIAKWLEVVRLATKDRWYFIQIGEVLEDSFDEIDLQAFKAIKQNQPENLYLKTEYLADESVFNDIIHHSDIVFAVYRDFSISSNMLGKAAAFQKPIVVADNHLMGLRVAKYRIGLGVSQNDPRGMLAALEQLATQPPGSDCFAHYRQDFSHQALNKQLFDFVAACNQFITNETAR